MAQETLNQVRSTVVGIGGFGLHAIVHLAPRLRFVNEQRRLVNPNLPDLDQIVSYALIMPRRDKNTLELWLPLSQNLQEISPFDTQEFWKEVDEFARELRTGGIPKDYSDNATRERQCLQDAYDQWRSAHNLYTSVEDVFLGEIINEAMIRYFRRNFRIVTGSTSHIDATGGRVSREAILHSLMEKTNAFGTQLEFQLGIAYQDLVQPIEDQTEVTVYTLASMCDDWASALVWPLGHLLKERLRDYEVETVALLSTGPYSPPPYRTYEEATAFVGLYEFDYLSRSDVDHRLRGTTYAEWPLVTKNLGKPGYDRTYLLDAVKVSRATAKNEREVVVSIANAMELFLAGSGDRLIQEHLAAGVSISNNATYSALGAAVKFLPVQKIHYWVSHRLAAEVVRDSVLAVSDDALRAAREQGEHYAVDHNLTLEQMGRAVVADVPIEAQQGGAGTPLPSFRLRDRTLLLPPALRPTRQRHRQLPLVRWYREVNAYRLELTAVPNQVTQVSGNLSLSNEPSASRQMGMWRLNMYMTAGTTQLLQDLSHTGPSDTAFQAGSTPVWLTSTPDTTLGNPLVAARAIGYLDGYLGTPIRQIRHETDQSFQALVGEQENRGELERSIVGRFRADLVQSVEQIITSSNYGLVLAQAWLRGVLTTLHQQLALLPEDNEAIRAFDDRWTQQHIALEQALGGRPGPDGEPETRGLAQHRPEPAALIGRAAITALFLIFTVFAFLRLQQTITLMPWQMWALGFGLVAAPFVFAGLFWLIYSLRAAWFRRRTLQLFGEQIDFYVTESVHAATESALRHAYATVASVLAGINRDIEAAETWRDDNLTPTELRISDQSDTILRQAIGDQALVDEVAAISRVDRDRLLQNKNLWEYPDRSIQKDLDTAITDYATPPVPDEGNTDLLVAQPEVWSLLRNRIVKLSEQFINQKLKYANSIESYIAKYPETAAGLIAPTVAENHEGGFDPGSYLVDMAYLAKPYIFLEDAQLIQPIVAVDIVGVNLPNHTFFTREVLAELRPDSSWSTHPPTLVKTLDPFSITYLRSLHGLPAKSMSRWERYSTAFAHLAPEDRELLRILPSTVYELNLAKSGETLFPEFDVDLDDDPAEGEVEGVSSADGEAAPAGDGGAESESPT